MKAQKAERTSVAAAQIFAGLEPEEVEILEDVALLRQYLAGESIFRIGDSARTLLVVAAGTVGLTIPVPIKDRVDDVTLEEKEPGSVIAWSALVPPHRFTLSAVAKTDVELHCFDRVALEEIFTNRLRIQSIVVSNLNRVIASRVALLEALVARDVRRFVSEKYA